MTKAMKEANEKKVIKHKNLKTQSELELKIKEQC